MTIKIFLTVQGDFLIWTKEDLSLLSSYRIMPDVIGLNLLPVSLKPEHVKLLIGYLKVAKLVKTNYYIPRAEDIKNYNSVYDVELQKWQEEKNIYNSSLRDIHVFKIDKPKPQKPKFPVCIEINSLNYPWVKVVDADEVTSKADFVDNSKYQIFLSLWHDGWWIGDGKKFGGDYLLYQQHPDTCHSSYILTVSDAVISVQDLVCLSRLGTAVKKNHVFCSWDNKLKRISFFRSEWSGWV